MHRANLVYNLALVSAFPAFSLSDMMFAGKLLIVYSPLPNIRPGPNYRLVGDEGSELIRDQDLFTNHLG